MERKLIILSMFLVFALQRADACDACGCSVSGGGIGMLTAYRYNYIGLQWQSAHFVATPEHGQGARDGFHSLELAVRYHFTDRLKVLINQPFKVNVREEEGASRSIDGFSDTRILANYTFLRNVEIGEESALYWELGAGLKLPMGKYDPDIHSEDLPENFNIGNGSWGYLFQSNLILNRRNFGVVLSNVYQYNRETKEGYKFGSQLSTQLSFFHQLPTKKDLKISPYAGLYSEWVSNDKYANKKTVTGTSGTGLFVTAGFQLKKGDWTLGCAGSLPVVQNYSHGEARAEGRFSCQVVFVF